MLTTAQVRARLRAQMKRAGSAAAWGRQHRVSPAYLSDIMQGRREPGSAVLRPLGLRRLDPAYAEVTTSTPKASTEEARA